MGRRNPRRMTDPEFRRGLATGFRRAVASPAGRSAFQHNFRLAVIPAAIGSAELLQWVKRSRLAHGETALTTSEELLTCLLGAVVAASAAHLVRWLWQRSHDASQR
jgi:hypothetical protein